MKRLPSLVALVGLAFAGLLVSSCSSVSPSSGSVSGSSTSLEAALEVLGQPLRVRQLA